MRADLVYLDLGMSSMQVDTRERGFSYAYDAPLDMRMDPDQELTAREIVNTWDERRLARALREYGEERYAERDRPRDRPRAARARRSRRPSELVEAITAAIPAPARFAGGHPGQARRSRRSGSPSTTSSASSTRAAARLGAAARRTADWPGSPSTRSRTAASSASSPTARRGCICPPDLPVCACGREPEAELLTRRSIVPRRGEVAANPRSESARLRAARKLEPEGRMTPPPRGAAGPAPRAPPSIRAGPAGARASGPGVSPAVLPAPARRPAPRAASANCSAGSTRSPRHRLVDRADPQAARGSGSSRSR